MEAFVAVAKAQGDESQLSSGNSLESSTFGNSCRSLGGSSSVTGTSGKGFSLTLPHHDLSRRGELLDNGHYWKYLTGDSPSTIMVPQEPTMAANDGVTKTPSPTGTSSSVVVAEDTPTSASSATVSAVRSDPPLTETSSSSNSNPSKMLPAGAEAITNKDSSSSSPHDGPVNTTPPTSNSSNSKRMKASPAAVDTQSMTGSDIEEFDGKIVYNPDGSAWLIEDSEMSEDDAIPHFEGCVVDGRGLSLSQAPSIPQITNAFYVSRNPSLYNALYGQAYSSLLQDKKMVPEIPIMHSYRVYSIRDKSGDNCTVDEESDEVGDDKTKTKRTPNGTKNDEGVEKDNVLMKAPLSSSSSTATSECSSVPIKPILMCFICKLSFGYTKSFIAHAMGDHNLILIDDEKTVLNQRNVSAIIQPIGKNKDPTISFLEPVANKVSGVNQHQPQSVPINRALLQQQQFHRQITNKNDSPLLFRSNSNHSDDNANNIKSSPISSPDPVAAGIGSTSRLSNSGMDLTRKSPVSSSGRSSASPGANLSPVPTTSSTPNNLNNNNPLMNSPSGTSHMTPGNPPNFITGTTIGVCPEHINGRPSGVDCSKCEMILNSSRMGLGNLHTRNSCKTLKCPKCNWHYKYQETLEIHLREKHPETDNSCIYCVSGQPHPRLGRGESYSCGYKPYRCEVCNYSTTTKGNLSIHMQSDKHLNNMQELQNGGLATTEMMSRQQPQVPPQEVPQIRSKGSHTPEANAPPQNQKPRPVFRCDVCQYETNVARNLRIHMTSEKHTHNMMVLQQNVKHMQHLSVLQQAQQNPFDPAAALLSQFHPQLQQMAAAAASGGDKSGHPAIADMAYNQALLIQMMTGGQMPPHIPPELAPHMDLGLNPDTMEPPPEPPDPSPSHLFQCCVCTIYSTDSLESLSHHLTQDRTKLREQEILSLVAGNYLCRLCQYKTNLKANFQLHCKTDKHLQRLQHVNHVKEGGIRNEWKLKYLSMSNPVQVRCNCCDYYTNSAHKLQLHAAHQRHEISVLIFRHIQATETNINEDARIYACALCGFTTRIKLQLLQHTRSLKHLQLEQLHILQRRAEGKEATPDLAQVFRVLEQPDSDTSGHNNHSSSSADVSPYDDQESRRDEGGHSSVLKNALEKDSSSDDLNCPFCSFTSESETRLQAHVLTKHSNSELSSSAGTSGSARRHNSISPDCKSEGNSGESGMTCPLCQDVCSDRNSLENHVMQVHSVNSEGLQRLLLLVNQSHWLNNSSRSSNNDEDKDNKSESESAMEDASDSEEFRCHTCSKCFRTLDELCSHQNELGHLEIKQTPGGPGYLCWKKGCNQYFPTAPSLQMHFREIHARGKPAMAVSEKHVYKYRCNECSLAFKSQQKLELHSTYHAIRDASKCPLCGRSFRSLSALEKHVETSHTELSQEELLIFKQNLASNPLILAGLTGQILDPMTTELLKKESARDEEMMMLGDEDNRDQDELKDDSGDSNDSSPVGVTKEQQLFEDYLNTQQIAEDGYNDVQRKYKCHRCRVAFTRQSYLTSHNKTLLHRKGEKMSYPMEKYMDPNRPHKCQICKESFTQLNILNVHFNSVSHLHKLKRAMQDQEKDIPASLLASLPQSISSLVTPSTPIKSVAPLASSSSTPTTMNASSSSPSMSSDNDDDKKPYRCNICKVAYSQGSTLDIHMRSVLHQTRASKLQELAISGQIDLTRPLIEQPEPQHKNKLVSRGHEISSPTGSSNKGDISFSTPIRTSSPMSNRSHTPNAATSPHNSVSPIIASSSPQSLSCSRCNFMCSSQEQLLKHQHLYCVFQTSSMSSLSLDSHSTPIHHQLGDNSPPSSPTPQTSGGDESFARFNVPSKKSSHMFKHLLQSYGFEMVMQFNQYHQKRQATRDDNDEEMDDRDDAQSELDEEEQKEFPELAKATCKICKKVFSTLWILKAHCEEVHKQVISMRSVEHFAKSFKDDYLSKMEAGGVSTSSGEGTGEREDDPSNVILKETPTTPTAMTSGNGNNSNTHSQQGGNVNPTAPSTPTPTGSATPGSVSAESLNGNNSSAPGHNSSNSNAQMSLAQHMNDMGALLAASQLQHFGLNPMMLATLGIPLGFNMNALAAMNLQPPPLMMMPPQFDPSAMMNQMNQMGQSSQTTPPMFPSPRGVDPSAMAKQQQHILQQQQAAASSQQKRARTRITDDQLKILRAHFDINNSPSEDQIQQMAQQSGLPPKVIKHWFRNTLFKERQRNKDSPYNFSNPPSTTLNLEEYEKTGEAKVMPMPLEEQKQYVDIPAAASTNKKESHGKKHSHSHHMNQMNQMQLQMQMQQSLNHDSTSELSETESRHEDEKPMKMPRIKSERCGSPEPSTSTNNNIATATTSSSPSLTLSSLISSQLNPHHSEDVTKNMLPPPKHNSFATPSHHQVPNASLLSLASPTISLHSPGSSGRSDTPLNTTPPLSQGSANDNMTTSSSGKRANRTRFTDYQIKVLQEFFQANSYPKDQDLEYLSSLLKLSPRVIVVWFQNRRQQARKAYENQTTTDSNSGDEAGVGGRFQRTPGLNYQCKKCLLVFQRYYELIRHQKTHCFKEEDAQRSAQAQAAAASIAAALSEEDSNSSNITDNNSLASSCGPSPAPNSQSGRESANVSQSSANNSASIFGGNEQSHKKASSENHQHQNDSFQCDKCNLVFPRFDLWREHQLVHIMNPNLFPSSFSPESPFGILQQHAHSQQQQQQQQQQQGQSQSNQICRDKKDSYNESNTSAASSIAGDATAKRKWSADELMTDDDKDEQPRDKRLRTTILPEQLDYLYQKYQIESNPSRKMLETIAREVGLKKRVVQVWFQNTRARERKGQFRAHAQVINKRCPFCPALFKVKSALETHLAAKHADQYTKGDINIDALPDEEIIESASSPLGDTKVPISFGNNSLGANSTNSLGAAPTSPSSNIMAPFLHSLSTHAELESSLKKLYEESLKRYAQEVQAANQNGTSPNDNMRFIKGEPSSPGGPDGPTVQGSGGGGGDCPLDLSKPVDLTRAMDASFLDSQDYLSDGEEDDDEMQIVDDAPHENPDSPASSIASSQRPTGPGTNNINAGKRFRTQLAPFQVKVMKSLFADYKTPTMAECEMLGRELGLVKRVIQVWYQNQRAKSKRQVSSTSSEPESPAECTLCGVKYSSKYFVQDHIFTKAHMDMVKSSIQESKGPDRHQQRKQGQLGTRGSSATTDSFSVTDTSNANFTTDEMMNFLQLYGLSTSSSSSPKGSALPILTGAGCRKSSEELEEQMAGSGAFKGTSNSEGVVITPSKTNGTEGFVVSTTGGSHSLTEADHQLFRGLDLIPKIVGEISPFPQQFSENENDAEMDILLQKVTARDTTDTDSNANIKFDRGNEGDTE